MIVRQHAEAYTRDASMQRLRNVCPCVLNGKIDEVSVDDFSFGLGSLKGSEVALNATLHSSQEFLQDS